MAAELADHRGPTVLLGVTRELAAIAPDLTAVERNPSVIANLWPGDSAAHRAVVGDWRDLRRLGRTFVAAVADCALNNLVEWPDAHEAFYGSLAEVLDARGRFVCRVFATPDPCPSLESVRAEAISGRAGSFHGFKWRLTMAWVHEAGNPNVAVQTIVDVFDDMFPDRSALARANRWTPQAVATIDVYRGSTERYCFPTRNQFRAVIPEAFAEARWSEAGTYDLAERCPLLVIDRRS